MRTEQTDTLIIIGAAKSGTTSLFRMLAQHPGIVPSSKKETGFFSNDNTFERGMEWYQQTFYPDLDRQGICMEATPAYLTWSEKAAPRIKAAYHNANLRMVAIFRDPVERAYSHYWHRVRLGQETLPFAMAIEREEERLDRNWERLSRDGDGQFGYLRASCYASRLRPFLDHFDRGAFFFMLREDILAEQYRENLERLFKFLGIASHQPLEHFQSNRSSISRSQKLNRLYWRLKATRLSELYRSWIPDTLRQNIYKLLFPPFKYPKMERSVELKLRERFSGEINQLEAIIDRDLSHWRVRPDE